MERIAVISDIHANLEATKTVLEDIKSRGITKIICLGDIIAKGTHINECVELIRENCFIVISGNTDRHFSTEHSDLSVFPEYEQNRIKWNQSILTPENRYYLSQLPFCRELYMSGSLIRMFHATPEADNVPVLNVDTVETKSKMFEPTSKTISQEVADVVIYGHIHHQYLDKLYNKTLINAGSVGSSFDAIRSNDFDSDLRETTQAHYLIIEGEYGKTEYGSGLGFQFVRVPYDIKKELSDVDKNLEPELHTHELTTGMYQDMKKIEQGFADRGVKLRS